MRYALRSLHFSDSSDFSDFSTVRHSSIILPFAFLCAHCEILCAHCVNPFRIQHSKFIIQKYFSSSLPAYPAYPAYRQAGGRQAAGRHRFIIPYSSLFARELRYRVLGAARPTGVSRAGVLDGSALCSMLYALRSLHFSDSSDLLDFSTVRHSTFLPTGRQASFIFS